jgi:glycerol-3-phosphate acyltransferase PlsX
MLKAMQGTAQTMTRLIKDHARKSWWQTALLVLQAPLFSALKKKLDYAEKGGALLLGLQKPVIVAHGCSNERAIMNALLYADRVVREATVLQFNHELASMIKRVKVVSKFSDVKVTSAAETFLVEILTEKKLFQ